MEVPREAFRRELDAWIDRVRAGQTIVVTEQGIPVARVTPVGPAAQIESLTWQGVLSEPRGPRPVARGAERVHASAPVSDYVSEQRR
jgi:prevent-host-death family protein